jgi:hypothetical protein
MTAQTVAAPPGGLSRRAWGVLALTMVFWVADGYDTFVLLIIARPTLTELLPHDQLHNLTAGQSALPSRSRRSSLSPPRLRSSTPRGNGPAHGSGPGHSS